MVHGPKRFLPRDKIGMYEKILQIKMEHYSGMCEIKKSSQVSDFTLEYIDLLNMSFEKALDLLEECEKELRKLE